MIVGTPARLALESSITCAYEQPGLVALGYFVIHIGGNSYGVRRPNASMLACSLDAAKSRVRKRGLHVAHFADGSAKEIALALMKSMYWESEKAETFFGVSSNQISDMIHERELLWAPDGDAAFDDGSYILQFDARDDVRLVAFKSGDGDEILSLVDVRMPAADYYECISTWIAQFEQEWLRSPKAISADWH